MDLRFSQKVQNHNYFDLHLREGLTKLSKGWLLTKEVGDLANLEREIKKYPSLKADHKAVTFF